MDSSGGNVDDGDGFWYLSPGEQWVISSERNEEIIMPVKTKRRCQYCQTVYNDDNRENCPKCGAPR
jgi:hypothetical protein